jgi:hypothetical protein
MVCTSRDEWFLLPRRQTTPITGNSYSTDHIPGLSIKTNTYTEPYRLQIVTLLDDNQQVPYLEIVTASTSRIHMGPLETALYNSWIQASVQRHAIFTEDSQPPPRFLKAYDDEH